MKEGMIKDVYQLLIKELQTILTLSYLSAVGIGMLFNYQKYAKFGINIFDYSDLFDFLIAPFSDLYILLFSSISIAFIFSIIRFDAFLQNKHPVLYSKLCGGLDRKSWYSSYKLIIFSTSFILYLLIAADYYGNFTKDKIEQSAPISIRYMDNEIKKGQFIGKTKEVVFLLKQEQVVIVPITTLVKEIRFQQ